MKSNLSDVGEVDPFAWPHFAEGGLSDDAEMPAVYSGSLWRKGVNCSGWTIWRPARARRLSPVPGAP